MSDFVETKGELLERLDEHIGVDSSVDTVLRTSDKVLARITDGIYREPQSALRELIVNAYDADARNVVVRTDPPRFDSITVEDDGNGMSHTTLANVLFSIGGSFKRSAAGADLNVTSTDDATLSPGGRRMIGKMGIGLFSVAQLTHSFQIITKVAGEDTRTIAVVYLRQFADSNNVGDGPDDEIESGQVRIWRERAVDLDSHGTTIVLTSVRDRARELLSSADVWSAVQGDAEGQDDDDLPAVAPPKYYVGYWKQDESALVSLEGGTANLPWSRDDPPKAAFKKLVDSVWDELYAGVANPKLETLFDNYLQAVWEIALALPLPYVDVHPFDLELDEEFFFYRLASNYRGQPDPVGPKSGGTTLAEEMGLIDSVPPEMPFRVLFDELELARPIRFRGLPHSSHAITQPMLFAGSVSESFPNADPNLSGGPLRFEAYLLWNPKIVPTEHRGVLVRIHGASGTLFDENFMHYQIAETTRLRQATLEVFVHEGLEGALNIDRESFNAANPHFIYITKWVHGAIRQFTSTHKKEAAALHRVAREKQQDAVFESLEVIVEEAWARTARDLASPPPVVHFDDSHPIFADVDVDRIFDRTAVLGTLPSLSVAQKRRAQVVEKQMAAIAAILETHRAFDQLDTREQHNLLEEIRKVLTVEDV